MKTTRSRIWALLEDAAAAAPSALALVDGAERHDWASVHRRASALAAWLGERGVERGERVAIAAPNSSAFLEAYFAAGARGAVLVPLNTRLAPPELAAILEDARPRALLVDARTPAVLGASGLPHDSVVWIGPDAPDGATEHATLVADARPAAPVAVPADDVAQLYYTSGTTGRPKGVRLTHGNVATHAEWARAELELGRADVWLHAAPMYHLADAWAVFALTAVGARHVALPAFDARAALGLMAAEGVTLTNLVPTMLQRVLAEQERAPAPLPALRLLLSGGAPIAPEVVERTFAGLGCDYAQTYGMTETSPFLTISRPPAGASTSPAERLRYACTTGRPFGSIELEVVDDAGRAIPCDGRSVGEIRVRGATVSPGYWERPDEDAAAFKDGWLHTGDLARVDAEGYVTIVDRKKDVIVTGGENVYSIEVENALYEHPAVLEAAAFGRPDPEWGEAVHAVVALREGARVDPEELRVHCRARLAGFKCPRSIEIVDELPKTGSGKIRKDALRRGGEGNRASR